MVGSTCVTRTGKWRVRTDLISSAHSPWSHVLIALVRTREHCTPLAKKENYSTDGDAALTGRRARAAGENRCLERRTRRTPARRIHRIQQTETPFAPRWRATRDIPAHDEREMLMMVDAAMS